jgi:hypothetical protein
LINDKDYADALDKANLEKSQALTEKNQAQSNLDLQNAKILDAQEQIQATDQRLSTLQTQEKTLQENISVINNTDFKGDPDKATNSGSDVRGSVTGTGSTTQGYTDDSGNYHPGVSTPETKNAGEGATADPARTAAQTAQIEALDKKIETGKSVSETTGELINTNKAIIDGNKSQAADLRSEQANVRAQQQSVQEKYDNGQITADQYRSQMGTLNSQNQSLGNQARKLENEANELTSQNNKLAQDKELVDSQILDAQEQRSAISNPPVATDTSSTTQGYTDDSGNYHPGVTTPNPDAPVDQSGDPYAPGGYDNGNTGTSDVPDYQAYESNYPSDDQSYEANYPYESSSSDDSSQAASYEDNYSNTDY